MITLKDLLTSSGKYPDREKSPDCTQAVKDAGTILLSKVNAFLSELGWAKPVVLSSGFRTAASNSATPNSAKKSSHCQGRALDVADDVHQTLGKLVTSRSDLLRKHGLFVEDLESTKTWVHLDDADRSDRPSRSFKP